jgi:hypothetical protein
MKVGTGGGEVSVKVKGVALEEYQVERKKQDNVETYTCCESVSTTIRVTPLDAPSTLKRHRSKKWGRIHGRHCRLSRGQARLLC